MTTLLVGFDSAWTLKKRGALVGILHCANGEHKELGSPGPASFAEAEQKIRRWQSDFSPSRTIVLLDQPTVVPNQAGQRPVENIVASPVSRRYGGVQPANRLRNKGDMFGQSAPVWNFLAAFDFAQNPFAKDSATRVLETYPALALIAFGWTLGDERRPTGRLPRYNPERTGFSREHWTGLCEQVADALGGHGLAALSDWMTEASQKKGKPNKHEQDCVDACICLLVGLHLAEQRGGLLVGQAETGYMVVPASDALQGELRTRCVATKLLPEDWIHPFFL